ncbi:septin 2 [Catenaria anguillulae PL171]|uniref:Septin 2 n=1 Tax=Catenaria anguillulae PL171 TaxID=765915 RepID=A0A1Y2I4M7_9FUNG|nr:septin 2 [Catenaria anguillulae PL171]
MAHHQHHLTCHAILRACACVPTAFLFIANGITPIALNNFVGFSNLPNQHHRRSVKRGFHFTVMVVGESGLGKATLINTLFNSQLYPDRKPTITTDLQSTLEIKQISEEIVEQGVSLRLTVIDTPGFGDAINNNEDSWKPIIANVEARYDSYLEQELRLNRSQIVDNRIHACLYFIPPTGHALRQIDIEFMKRIAPRVNLVPIIAKSDTLTEEEVQVFKQRIMDDITHHQIPVYHPPTYPDDDPETLNETRAIDSKIPFAVVGSTKEVTTPDGRKVRGRAYPWGVIEVDNEAHNDFVKLRQMLVRTHMEELKLGTDQGLYESYRTSKLRAMGREQEIFSKEINPAASMEEQRLLHEQRLAKMENDMKLVFQQKVQEKEAKLKQSEEELYARHREMRDALERQRSELEDKKRKLEGLIHNAGLNKPTTPEKSRKKGIFK